MKIKSLIILIFSLEFILQVNAKTTYTINSGVDYGKRRPYYRNSSVPLGTPSSPSVVAKKHLTSNNSATQNDEDNNVQTADNSTQPNYKKYEELSEMKPYYKNWKTVTAYNKINIVGSKLLESSNLNEDVVFSVKSSREVNAYTNVQDQIVLFTGILKFVETEDELAAVIGHELGHVLYQDPKRTTIRKTLLDALDMSNIDSKIDRNQEYRADIASVDLLVNAGYNPLAVISILNKISDHYIDIDVSHPTGRKRLNNVYTYIEKQYPKYIKNGYNTVSYNRALKVIGK